MRLSLIFMALFLAKVNFAQLSAFKQAENRVEKGQWAQARKQLEKAAKKESGNVALSMAWAEWFFDQNNPGYQLDSAYANCQQAIRQFQKLQGRSKDRLWRSGVDSTRLILFAEKIDSAAFVVAKNANTESAYDSYIQRFPFSKLRAMATELSDEVSFLDALKSNTYQSVERYVSLHPSSHRAEEAKKRYEKLLFENKTRDGKYKSYLSFVREFPTSPYRDLADREIFEVATALGDTSAFLQYIEDFPTSKWKPMAVDWLFHLYSDYEKKIPPRFLNDSLRNILRLNESYWATLLDEGKFGFMDAVGEVTLAPQFETMEERYLCGSIYDDVLTTSLGLVSRDGSRIAARHPIQSSLGLGFFKIGDTTCVKIIHKSGRVVIENCSQEVKLIGKRFLAARQNGRWRLFTLTGRPLLEERGWDGIEMIEDVLVLSRLGKKVVLGISAIESSADGNVIAEELVFDEVKRVGVDRLLVRNGSLEGLLNSKLEFVVPFGRQTLSIQPYGLVRKANDQYSVAELAKELEDQWWDHISFSKQWLLLKRKATQQLFDLNSKKIIEDSDSCWFARGLAFAKQKDSIRVHINSGRTLTFSKESRLNFVKSRDSIRYFFVEAKQQKVVYDIQTGQRLFTHAFDELESFGENVMLVSRKGKKGLLSKYGKLLLPVEYQAVVQLKDDYWSIYKEKKFGLYDGKNNRLVRPTYSRNVSLLNNEVLIVFKHGYFGLMSWQEKPLTPFEYDDIQPWGEDEVWVKRNSLWTLMDFRSGKIRLEGIKEFELIATSTYEKTMVIRRDNDYGIVGTKSGVVIPPAFATIINVGTDEHPLYFTDKEVVEAQIHVVIYYNKLGKLIRKQVYEEHEFEKIICGD